jgi:DNA polymerase
LHYYDAFIRDTRMPWDDSEGKPVYRPTLWYAHEDQITHQWGITHTHGGKQFENIVQGIARDVLAVKLIDFEEHDLPVCLHVHDEGACMVPNDPFSPGLPEMIDIMSTPVDWAPGLLLGADGFEGSYYHK